METSEIWRTARVFTQARGFGEDVELEEQWIITVRLNENEYQALEREGFNPLESRLMIIDL